MKRVLSLACCAVLAGCLHAAPGEVKSTETNAPAAVTKEKAALSAFWVEKNVVKGKTTKQDLLAALGAPAVVEPNDKQLPKELLATIKTDLPPIARTKEFWKYRTAARIPNSLESNVFNVMFFLDDDGVALDYLVSESVLRLP